MRRTDPEDSKRSYFRCQTRVFVLNGEWYFTTREGECGPFRSKERADDEVDRFIAERKALKDFQKSREAGAAPVKENKPKDLSIVPMEETPYTAVNGGLALDTENQTS